MYGTSALFLIDFISIRVMLEFERSHLESSVMSSYHACLNPSFVGV